MVFSDNPPLVTQVVGRAFLMRSTLALVGDDITEAAHSGVQVVAAAQILKWLS